MNNRLASCASLTAVLFAAGFLTEAIAADMRPGSVAARGPGAVPAAAPIEFGNLYFGVDWNSHKSLAGYTGVLYAPHGMAQSGLRLSAFGIYGKYEYSGDHNELFRGTFGAADALIGWSSVFSNGAATVAVGVNYQDHRVRPHDPGNSVEGSEVGFKVQGDLWANPTPATLAYALASYSTAFDTYYALGRLGYDFTASRVFFGPEVGALGNDRTDQIRLGAHLTGIRLGSASLTVSGGWMHERGEGSGAYATAMMDFTF